MIYIYRNKLFDLELEYRILNAYYINNDSKAENILNVVYDLINSSISNKDHNLNLLRVRSIMKSYKESKDSIYDAKGLEIEIGITNRGLKFILLATQTLYPLIVNYSRGSYKVNYIYSTSDIASEMSDIDNYSSHIYYIDILIGKVKELMVHTYQD